MSEKGSGGTLLSQSRKGRSEAVEVLLNQGTDPDVRGGQDGSVLQAACASGADKTRESTHQTQRAYCPVECDCGWSRGKNMIHLFTALTNSAPGIGYDSRRHSEPKV